METFRLAELRRMNLGDGKQAYAIFLGKLQKQTNNINLILKVFSKNNEL